MCGRLLFFHTNTQTVTTKNAQTDPSWGGTSTPAKEKNPGGLSTWVRTHDVWRGRKLDGDRGGGVVVKSMV